MNLNDMVLFCRSLPHIVEDIKWENDLVFSIEGGKMFCVFSIEEKGYSGMCFKVDDHRFLELTDQPHFIPAPYMARAKWVKMIDPMGITTQELKAMVTRSHQLYFEKLSKKKQRELQGS